MKKKLKEIPYLGVVLIIIAAMPFVLYYYSPYFGGKDLWYGSGNKHGPWRQTFQSFTIGLPILFAFLPVNFVALIIRCIQKKYDIAKYLVILFAVAASIMYLQVRLLFWLID